MYFAFAFFKFRLLQIKHSVVGQAQKVVMEEG